MLSLAVLYLLAARWTHSLPLYPDSNLEIQPDYLQKLVSEDASYNTEGEQSEVNHLYPLLPQHNEQREILTKAQQDNYANMMDDLKAVVLKMAAADRLRTLTSVRSQQGLPKSNKRACFWKYCVTN
ncbi:urotensin-related peptide 1 [Corythoichthys intestinalis]|uniref:urotensin-related peptide 1 n=1 Tax=Corythoichthys intestinalis TaxID=161448 RepID=UPI0025A55113|nr:urotensin-related peptide 1 [Corythoichthys intestinalis]